MAAIASMEDFHSLKLNLQFQSTLNIVQYISANSTHMLICVQLNVSITALQDAYHFTLYIYIYILKINGSICY